MKNFEQYKTEANKVHSNLYAASTLAKFDLFASFLAPLTFDNNHTPKNSNHKSLFILFFRGSILRREVGT